MITEIEGEVIGTEHSGEPWEYSTEITRKLVTGWLRDAVLRRTGLTGEVTSLEDSSSYGTCELCGSYFESITLFVDGEKVYSGEDSTGMDTDNYPNPFIKLNNWLNEKESN